MARAMTLPPRDWTELHWPALGTPDTARWIAVLPLAATEQHGPHLPVKVDAAINAGILSRALELMHSDAAALVLPALPYGKSDEHLAFPGTLTLSHETLAKVWYEIAASVHRAGVRKILFFNSHGGQPQLLDIVCRDLRVKLGMLAVNTTWWQLIDMNDLFAADEIRLGIHGGQIETSVMLHLACDDVRMELAETFVSAAAAIEQEFALLGPEAAARFGWQAQDLHPAGVCGDARAATGELGRAVVERAAPRLVALVDDISRYPLSRIVAAAGDRAR